MFRISTTSINQKKNNNIITSNPFQTPNCNHSNASNAFHSLLNPFSAINNKHNNKQITNTFTSSDLVIHQDENILKTNNINKRINLNNFSPSTPGYYQSKLHGNQNTTIYNSNGKPINHSIHITNQSKIQKPKVKLQINNSNSPIKSDDILGKHLQQSQLITNKLQLNGDSITHGTIKQSNIHTLSTTATKSIPNTPKHNLIHGNIQSKSKPDSTLQHTTPFNNTTTTIQSLPNTPKHKLYSKTYSHSNHNISKTPSHSNYNTSKTYSHSNHSTLIGKQCTSECDILSKSLPSTPTRILKSNSNNHQHYSYSANNTPISKLKSILNNEHCHAHS